VVWIAWDDPSRPSLPEDKKQIARAWNRREDPRQGWLEAQLRRGELNWDQHEAMTVASGVLLLMRAEGNAAKSRFAKPRNIAQCGQTVPVGIAPGSYRVETTMINELPEGAHCCLIARWLPVP
jgi:hypothetical protein